MNRPDDIPEWAWEKAIKVELDRPSHERGYIGDVPNLVSVLVIARAMLSALDEERESCAQRILAQRYVPLEMRRQLAFAIRNRKGA